MESKSEYKITKSRSFIFNILAGLIFLSGYFILVFIMLLNPDGALASSMIKNNNIATLFALIGLIIIVHEFLHGITYKLFGANVKYGIKLLNFYTMDISGKYYTPRQMLAVLLAPLTVLTLLLLAFGLIYTDCIYYIFIGLLFNLAGSTGDISMSIYILRNRKGCKIRDESYGFSLHF